MASGIVKVGKHTYGAHNIIVKYLNHAELVIGNFCSIATNIQVYLGGNHRTDWITTFPFGHIFQTTFPKFNGQGCPISKGDVIIGNDVWICDNVVIMSGVTIGDGAVIANNSHVIKNVEPYSIVGGNPAQLIKYRFSKEQIENLLKIQWWNWSDTKVNENSCLLSTSNIDEFINKHKVT